MILCPACGRFCDEDGLGNHWCPFCSPEVSALSAPRSPEWPKTRATWIKDHPACEACGRRENLNVHHIVPFHVDPSRELDPGNLVTLCEGGPINCHYLAGHCGTSWADYSRDINWSVATLRTMIDLLRRGSR